MEEHFALSDAEFEEQFRLCTLNPLILGHEAHLRLAWINIKKYGIEKTEKDIQEQLEYFVDSVGAKDKYNKTLTIVGIRAVYHFMLKSKSHNFKDFLKEFPKLKEDFKGLVNSHYSYDIFNSQKAKTEFLDPDLLPFD